MELAITPDMSNTVNITHRTDTINLDEGDDSVSYSKSGSDTEELFKEGETRGNDNPNEFYDTPMGDDETDGKTKGNDVLDSNNVTTDGLDDNVVTPEEPPSNPVINSYDSTAL